MAEERQGRKAALGEFPAINTRLCLQVLSPNVTLTNSLKEPPCVSDSSTDEMCNVEQEPCRAFPTQLPRAASASTKTGLSTDLRGGTEMACIFQIFNISFSFLAVVGSTIPTHHCCYFRELFCD